jgi:hypothetical protein
VINANVGRAIQFKKEQSDSHKKMIFTAIKNLGQCSPKEIKQELEKISRKYEDESDQYSFFIEENENEKIVKQTILRRETIQRKLKEMINEGLIIKNNNGKYSISELALSDFRYYSSDSAREFGKDLLANLLKIHFPTLNDLETNIEELITIFGFTIFYSLTEACKPIDLKKEDKLIENQTKDKLTTKWISQVIDHTNLLDSFVSAIKNQYTDKQIEEYQKKYLKAKYENGKSSSYLNSNNALDPVSHPMSTKDFWYNRFFYLISNKKDLDYKTKSEPLYELEEYRIKQITKILKKLYPHYYRMAVDAKSNFLGRPKEWSLEDRRRNFRSFDLETEEMS